MAGVYLCSENASAETVWEDEAERERGEKGVIVWELVISSLSNNCCN